VSFKVFYYLLLGFQLDVVRDMQLVHQRPHEFDVIAVRLSILIDERVRPQVAYVLINQWILIGVDARAIVLGRGVACKKQDAK
jgi:hypothetical protein